VGKQPPLGFSPFLFAWRRFALKRGWHNHFLLCPSTARNPWGLPLHRTKETLLAFGLPFLYPAGGKLCPSTALFSHPQCFCQFVIRGFCFLPGSAENDSLAASPYFLP